MPTNRQTSNQRGTFFISLNKFNQFTIPQLRNIPTFGPSGFLLAIYNSFRFLIRGREMIDEANNKFQAIGLFKMQFFSGWNVFVLRQDYIADLRGSRDKDLSLYHAQNDVSSLCPQDYFLTSVFLDRYLRWTTPLAPNQPTKTICITKSFSVCSLQIFQRTGMAWSDLLNISQTVFFSSDLYDESVQALKEVFPVLDTIDTGQ
jgi:hypothetical protein